MNAWCCLLYVMVRIWSTLYRRVAGKRSLQRCLSFVSCSATTKMRSSFFRLLLSYKRRYTSVFVTGTYSVQKKQVFLKSPTHWVFGVLLGFGLYWVFRIFLFEQAVGQLVGWFSSSAKPLFRSANTLDYLKICKCITYCSLEPANIRKSIINIDTTDWN